ncbi:MAG TPA: tetratricopeptide repeat protein [Fimbriimonas sp.]|nr:tetratricopeptide repeat protein [Fimbriimonas sp.]
MTTIRFLLGLCVGVSAAFGQSQAPQVLIVPLKKSATTADPSLSLANYLAQELDQDGRVSPVVWGMTDPAFRAAALSGRIRSASDNPSLPNALAVAQDLGAKYVFTYTVDPKGKGLSAHGELYLVGRSVWKDDKRNVTSKGGVDSREDESASIAHTWNLLLQASAFKELSPRPKVSTSHMSPGESPPVVTPVATAPPPDTTADDIGAQVEKLIASKKFDAASMLIRDAIDAKPLESKLRNLQVHILEQQGRWSQAADVACRALDILPDNHSLRLAALRDLMTAGRVDEAKEQLNQIVARHPTDPTIYVLEGQTYLALGDVEHATVSLDRAIQHAPSPSAYFWRSVARAALGGVDGLQKDLDSYAKAPLPDGEYQDAYAVAEAVIADATEKDEQSALPAFQEAAVSPTATATADQIDQLVRRCNARAQFLEQLKPPAKYKASHSHILLAQKLLAVSLLDIQDYLKSTSDDMMTDARINLGEAMKQSKRARLEVAGEQGLVRDGKPDTSST